MNISAREIDITPSVPRGQWGQTRSFNSTQLGNAERFAAQYSGRIKYCKAWDKWLIWDGKLWRPDHADTVVRMAARTVRSIYDQAKEITDNEDLKSSLQKHSRKSETDYTLRAMIRLAQSQPTIPVLPDHLDSDQWLFNCQNGTIDLESGNLRPHSQEDLMTKISPVEYRPQAECPIWQAFLFRILDGNGDLIDFVQKAIGYSLTGAVTEKALFFLYGNGDNGKTTLVEAVRQVMGDYAGVIGIDALMKKTQPEHRDQSIASVVGKRFVTSSEAAQGEALHESHVKHLTGMGRLTGRRLYCDAFEFDPQFKLFIDANHKPIISGTEDAIWNRFRLIPFTVQIPKPEQDRGLGAKLAGEAPGILAWAVQGCLRWKQEGLGSPETVTEATESYREEMDPVADFVADRCDEDPEAKETFSELYKTYLHWCEEHREKRASQKAFGLALDRKGFLAVRTSSVRSRKGLAIRRPPPVPGDTAYDA